LENFLRVFATVKFRERFEKIDIEAWYSNILDQRISEIIIKS